MERKTVKPIISRKHIWEKDEDGFTDLYAYSDGLCSGPICELCGKHFCTYCTPNFNDTLCNPHYICPDCGTALSEEHKEKYCMECGAKFDWCDALSQEEIELQARIDDARSRFKEKFPSKETIVKLIEQEPKDKQERWFNIACRLFVIKPDIEINSFEDFKIALVTLDLL